MQEQEEIRLTYEEWETLQNVLYHIKRQKDLTETLDRFTPQTLLLLGSAVSKFGQALDKVSPGWRGEA